MEGKRGMGLRVNKGIKSAIKKRKKRSSVIKGLINYLKSDSYFYSPLTGQSLTSYSSALGVEARKPLARKEGGLKERLLNYMISDDYLYAPIVNAKPQQSSSKTLIPHKENDFLVLSRKIVWETEKAPQHPVSDKQEGRGSKDASHELTSRTVSPNTPGLKEAKKQAVHHRSYRLST